MINCSRIGQATSDQILLYRYLYITRVWYVHCTPVHTHTQDVNNFVNIHLNNNKKKNLAGNIIYPFDIRSILHGPSRNIREFL